MDRSRQARSLTDLCRRVDHALQEGLPGSIPDSLSNDERRLAHPKAPNRSLFDRILLIGHVDPDLRSCKYLPPIVSHTIQAATGFPLARPQITLDLLSFTRSNPPSVPTFPISRIRSNHRCLQNFHVSIIRPSSGRFQPFPVNRRSSRRPIATLSPPAFHPPARHHPRLRLRPLAQLRFHPALRFLRSRHKQVLLPGPASRPRRSALNPTEIITCSL